MAGGIYRLGNIKSRGVQFVVTDKTLLSKTFLSF